MTALLNIWLSFIAGVLAPLAAVCVLPLYPAFLSYLSNQEGTSSNNIKVLGLLVTAGVISSLFLVGLIFTTILQVSLTNVIGILSPIAFALLGVVSLGLILDFDFSRVFPKINAPRIKNPYLSSYTFGFFFGAIVLPCNPGSLTVLFALSSSTANFVVNLLGFIMFGIGMSLPLLVFSFISSQKSDQVIGFLTSNKRSVNRITGSIMLVISLYYLLFVFGPFK